MGVSRVVLGRRERAVILEARGHGIIVWTLRFGDEVRDESDYFDAIDKAAQGEGVATLEKLIKRRIKRWSPDMVSDPIQESLLKLIADKKKATKPSRRSARDSKKGNDQKRSNVVDIMDALKKSVQKELRSLKAD